VLISVCRSSPGYAIRRKQTASSFLHAALGTHERHGVNPIGLLIWELLDGQRSVGQVVEAVRARVEDAPPQLEGDVMQFLNDVHERGLVVVE